MPLDRFPTELLEMIFGHCTAEEQRTVAKVCHRWADVVQEPMLQRICLVVSVRPQYHIRPSRTLLITKTILKKSNRQYTCFKIEWRSTETSRNMERLSALLDICEERFAVQRLYLRAPPSVSLVRFFVDRHEWIKNLVELHVRLEPASDSAATELYEMSFPNLKHLTWYECKAVGLRDDLFDSWSGINFENCFSFALNAPELCRLTVGMRTKAKRNHLRSRLRDVDACCLFLPTLELRTYANLESVIIQGLKCVGQQSMDNSKHFLQKLREITLVQCSNGVIERICDECSNLKQLTIDDPLALDLPLQIASVLSPTLEHLTISSPKDYFKLFGEATFLKLQSIRLACDLETDVTLVAPQLISYDALSTKPNNLTLVHTEKISTFKVKLDRFIMFTVPTPPNVTELHAACYFSRFDDGPGLLEIYIMNFPNVTRLTLSGINLPNLSFIDHLQNLEYFSARDITMRLIDAEKLATLKTLILSHCTLQSKTTDGVVSLMALNYVRMYQVSVYGASTDDQFPIRVNCKQPPIECVRTTYGGLKVFSSSGSACNPL